MTWTNQKEVSIPGLGHNRTLIKPVASSAFKSAKRNLISHSALQLNVRGPPTSAQPQSKGAVLGSVTLTPMSESQTHSPPPPLSPPSFLIQHPPHNSPLMKAAAAAAPLYKQRSWSPDAYRDEAWLRRQSNWKNRRSKSVTEEDVDELKACIELGFGFESSPEVELDQRLSDTLPALGLYYAVNKNYNDSLASNSKFTIPTTPASSTASDCDTIPSSPLGSPHTAILGLDDNPQTVKTRLRRWAQIVACAVRQSSC